MRRRHRSRRKRNRNLGKVELNMAAMLDMAFQLLAFFILTFHPSDVEAQISMLMPPEKPLLEGAGSSTSTLSVDDSLGFPLEITCIANGDGDIASLQIGGNAVPTGTSEQTLVSFSSKLQSILETPGFETAQLRVDPKLRYDLLIKMLDICTSRKLPNGENFTRIGISQLKQAGNP